MKLGTSETQLASLRTDFMIVQRNKKVIPAVWLQCSHGKPLRNDNSAIISCCDNEHYRTHSRTIDITRGLNCGFVGKYTSLFARDKLIYKLRLKILPWHLRVQDFLCKLIKPLNRFDGVIFTRLLSDRLVKNTYLYEE